MTGNDILEIMKPLIGITASAMFNRDHPYEPISYGQIHEYVEAVSDAGGIPITLPIARTIDETRETFERLQLDGILFAGGNDISTDYHDVGHPNTDDVDPARDQHEVELMKLALEAHVSILGICRGMQLINVVRGGTMYHDIATELPSAKNHVGYVEKKDHAHLVHRLEIVPRSKLAHILGVSDIPSNSRHHQAVKDLGTGLSANAYAEDGIVEGLEDMSESFILGVQSHPESLTQKNEPLWKHLFVSFVQASEPVQRYSGFVKSNRDPAFHLSR